MLTAKLSFLCLPAEVQRLPRVLQVFYTRLELLRHLISWAEPLQCADSHYYTARSRSWSQSTKSLLVYIFVVVVFLALYLERTLIYLGTTSLASSCVGHPSLPSQTHCLIYTRRWLQPMTSVVLIQLPSFYSRTMRQHLPLFEVFLWGFV